MSKIFPVIYIHVHVQILYHNNYMIIILYHIVYIWLISWVFRMTLNLRNTVLYNYMFHLIIFFQVVGWSWFFTKFMLTH